MSAKLAWRQVWNECPQSPASLSDTLVLPCQNKMRNITLKIALSFGSAHTLGKTFLKLKIINSFLKKLLCRNKLQSWWGLSLFSFFICLSLLLLRSNLGHFLFCFGLVLLLVFSVCFCFCFCGPKISDDKDSTQELWIKQTQFELGAYCIKAWKECVFKEIIFR